MATEPIVRNHSSHGPFDQQFRMASAPRPDILRFMSANVTRKTHITFLFLFLSGEPHFSRIDDDDKVSGVHMRRENRFSFAAQQVGSFHRDAAEDLALGVDDPPLAGSLAGFGGKRFHGKKKNRETTGDASACQPTRRMRLIGRTAKCALANFVVRA